MSIRIGFLISGITHVSLFIGWQAMTPEPVKKPAAVERVTLTMTMLKPPPAVPVKAEPQVQQPAIAPEPVKPLLPVEPPKPVVKAEPKTKVKTTNPVAKRVVKKPRKVVRKKPKPVPPKPMEKPAERPQPPREKAVAAAPPLIAKSSTQVRPQTIHNTAEKQHYLAALASAINRKKYYPRAAKRRNEQGQVVVSFVIRANGELTDLKVVKSSGHKRLDDAALKTLKRITPFRPIPATIPRQEWPISVPIAFSLKG